jgi:hypothetical protein
MMGARAYGWGGEIMGPGNYENVGKSQPVLIVINPMISPRTRMLRWGRGGVYRQHVTSSAGSAGPAGCPDSRRVAAAARVCVQSTASVLACCVLSR